MKRRALLGSMLAGAVAPTCLAQAIPTDGLAVLAARRGLRLGTMTTLYFLQDTPELLPLIVQDAGLVVPGWELTWERVQPRPDHFEFGPAEQVIAIATAHQLQLRGHCLIWHEALPPHFDPGPDAAATREVMRTHITGVCQHFAGQLKSWVVVNEPIYPEHNQPGSLRNTPFYHALGPDYIRQALEWAAAADPAAKLLINEYGIEAPGPDSDKRRTALLALLEKLVHQGAPLHALGIQGHLHAGETQFDPKPLRRFIQDVAALGLEVHITELDVVDRGLPGNMIRRDREVAAMLREFLDVVLTEPAVTEISTWGLDDRHSWMNDNEYARRRDGLPARGHLYDRQFHRKPAWDVMATALRDLPLPLPRRAL